MTVLQSSSQIENCIPLRKLMFSNMNVNHLNQVNNDVFINHLSKLTCYKTQMKLSIFSSEYLCLHCKLQLAYLTFIDVVS